MASIPPSAVTFAAAGLPVMIDTAPYVGLRVTQSEDVVMTDPSRSSLRPPGTGGSEEMVPRPGESRAALRVGAELAERHANSTHTYDCVDYFRDCCFCMDPAPSTSTNQRRKRNQR